MLPETPTPRLATLLMEGGDDNFGVTKLSEQLIMVAMATSVAERDGDTMIPIDAVVRMQDVDSSGALFADI